MDNDLSPVLGGGPMAWPFECQHRACRFKMPADVEADRRRQERLEECRARAEEAQRDLEEWREQARRDVERFMRGFAS